MLDEKDFYNYHLSKIDVYEAFNVSYGSREMSNAIETLNWKKAISVWEKINKNSRLLELHKNRYSPNLCNSLSFFDLKKDINDMLVFVAYDESCLSNNIKSIYINTILNYLNLHHYLTDFVSNKNGMSERCVFKICLEGQISNVHILKKIGIKKNTNQSKASYVKLESCYN